MPRSLLFHLSVVAIVVHAAALADEAATLSAALEHARNDQGIPFDLNVDCTDTELRRSLEIIGGQIAVWGRTRQIKLTSDERNEILDALIDADFPHFEARYGESEKAEKQEAPLRVSCRVRIELEGLEKSSIQLLDGEQSDELLGLAGRLLDEIGALSDRGVTATSLEDGLAKLGEGALAPEVLRLRLFTLPADGGGSILRVEGGVVFRQPYTPGQRVGEIRSRDLLPNEFLALVAALRNARTWELPVNLTAESVTELEVSVLGQRKTVIARSSFRPADPETQADFARLLVQLEQL